MKLIIVLMTTAFLQIGFAAEAQKITLSEKNASLVKIFKDIKIQSSYDFFGDLELLQKAKTVTINIRDARIEDVLAICFADQNLTYTINDKIVVFKEKKAVSKDTRFLPQDSLVFKGKVIDENGVPMLGATVRVKGSKKVTKTGNDGNFSIMAYKKGAIEISFIGYVTKEISLIGLNAGNSISVALQPGQNQLGEVNVVSTGYQDIPKERATGSFEIISKEQLQHSNSPNLVKRLEGITASMDFGNPLSGNANLSSNNVKRSPLITLTIRGKNTLVAPGVGVDRSSNSGQILVVVDGIPSPYTIDEINPDDVESINILKDAAAASIWGSRASNGVIVIKTKKGSYNKPANISFNTNINLTDKIDLFYKKFMTTSDFVDAQIQKYNNKYSRPVDDPTDLFQPQPFLSPVEEIINDQRLGKLTDDQAKAKLDYLRDKDVRNDLDKYFLRKTVVQNYSLSIDGGSEKYAYRLSGGFTNTRNNTVPSSGERYNLNYSTSVKPLKKLSIEAILAYNDSKTMDQAGGNRLVGSSLNTGFNPYAELADAQGNPLVVPRTYRPKYLQLLANRYGDKILDMSFKPLEDMNYGYSKNTSKNININLNANYNINSIFTARLTYGYSYGQNEQIELRGVNSYYTREIINIFTTREDYRDPFTTAVTPLKKLIPLGGIYTPARTRYNIQSLRGQLDANKTWNEKHQLNAFAAIDINQYYENSYLQQFYGYDEKTLKVNNSLPFGIEFRRLINDQITGLSSGFLPFTPAGISDFKTRALSFSSNAAYTYDRRYTISASIRKDLNSTSGPSTNKGAKPYTSYGVLWSINNEKFYGLTWLPLLQFRATFGSNGNINALNTYRPIITRIAAPTFGGNLLPYATTSFVSNSELRPEKSRMFNTGLNFGLKNNRLSGSVEYFVRNTKDLIKEGVLDPTTGFSSANYNSANLRSWGTDVILNSINLQRGKFSWTSHLNFSYNRVKILKLLSGNVKGTVLQLLGFDNVEGYELNRIAAYRWAGLDPQTGDPRGYDADGNILRVTETEAPSSPNYFNIAKIQSAPISTLRYFGSGVPVYYGAFRNTFSYGNFSLTAAFQYKLGYYFRKTTSDAIRYSTLFSDNTLGAAEYADRWKNPGDETRTNVPSLTFPASLERDEFYRLSEINVLKGDHIRFQEINLSYAFRKTNFFIKNPRIYANVNNLGIVWRANKAGIDPDINDYPMPRTYGLGLSANF
ncbi:SusC/RagA family TonB-linked outer membrane protein [Pedobacter steynii]|nr:SusC/RagA family TonB-linked outer membrane protein [Pedobacter steynii]